MADSAIGDFEQFRRLRIGLKDHPPEKSVLYRARPVPVIPLASVPDWNGVVALLQGMSKRHDPILFRGQNRDWFAGGSVSIQPAFLRTRLRSSQVGRAIEKWRQLLRPFLAALGETQSEGRTWEAGGQTIHVRGPQFKTTRRMVSLMFQPELAATMQHYGFPTEFLDVTPAPEVALWFALRDGETDKQGSLLYKPYRWSAEKAIEEWPSLYVFRALRRQVVDLTDGCLSPGFSERVSRQKACLISYVVYQTHFMNLERGGRELPWITDYDCYPDLLMILKLDPRGDWSELELPEPSWYFPPTDPIYKSLVRARAPYVRRYSS